MRIDHAVPTTRPERRSLTFHLATHIDLLVLLIAALLLPALVQMSYPLLRVPLGLALVLLAPGYALTAALFARPHDLDRVTRLALSFGLSATTLPLLALLLNLLPWGLQPWPMALALSGWIGGWCAVAIVRRAVVQRSATTAASQRPWSVKLRWQTAFAASVGIVVIAAFGWTSYQAFAGASHTPLTEFYALGGDGLAENYPREVAPGEPIRLQLGITNRERQAEHYRVEARTGDTVLATAGPIELAAGDSWSGTIEWTMPSAGDDQRIDLVLLRDGAAAPYRHLQLWINVKEALP